ncbi:uncharacterized protein LOC127860546 isoform X2 [Dreissena polymorpha]|uniref:WSC domain-containing protein n=1 Tax=Dreissena polymorpha TaxID=45954 RepID=A0A9D4BNH6_DREPO|nr:uncharacterized protein LOC127860546 isoform X2 [Dreissena polymorpha]KAH3702619.1 hypothetical protein DPMN_077644 [Dreissena polymorpha]
MLFYKVVCVLILATVKVNANYFLSNVSTTWSSVDCLLAEPAISYKNHSFQVNEPLGLELHTAGTWIGYQHAKLPFLFLGCREFNFNYENTYNVTRIGYCFNVCGNAPFGIYMSDYNDITSDLATKECRCANLSNIDTLSSCDKNADDKNEEHLCLENYNCSAIFTHVYANGTETDNGIISLGDCLTYYYPYFAWASCKPTKGNLKVMCSNTSYADSSATAAIIKSTAANWLDGNIECLKAKQHPASVESIQRGRFGNPQEQYFWTGIIRSITLIGTSTSVNESIRPINCYAFVNTDGLLQFASNGTKESICVNIGTNLTSTIRTTYTVSTNASSDEPVTHEGSTPAHTVTNRSSDGTSPEATTIGIGVAVGLLVVLGAVLVIYLLRKRGILPCKSGSSIKKPNESSKDYEDNVGNQTYFILEKSALSVVESEDHENTAYEQNEGNAEADNYNSIDETEDAYQSVKDEYDCTTNALRTKPTSKKPDNVYNKLKIPRPVDYDHVGIRGHNIFQEGSDYDTTSVARRNDGEGDYNHIPHPDSTTCARRNGSKDDYDVITGKKIKFSQSDSADYAHVRA